MGLITIKEFAERHKVSVQAVRAKGFKTVVKYGKTLISDSVKYEPRACYDKGRKPKRKTNSKNK